MKYQVKMVYEWETETFEDTMNKALIGYGDKVVSINYTSTYNGDTTQESAMIIYKVEDSSSSSNSSKNLSNKTE